MNLIYKKENIPLGVCHYCSKKQSKIAEGGFWIHGLQDKWVCSLCKKQNYIKSYPLGCEWCSYDLIIKCQGHTYQCPRCIKLQIGQYNL